MSADLGRVVAELVGIWQELLGPEEVVGAETDVLELGATSLLYVTVAVRMSEVFGPRLSVDVLLSANCVGEMAEAYVGAMGAGAEGDADG